MPEQLLTAEGEERRALVDQLFRDRDAYLSSVMEAVGHVHLPLVIDNRDEEAVRTVFPIPPIREAAAGLGFSNTIIDPDGVTRRLPVLRNGESEAHPPLGLAFLGYSGEDVEIRNGFALLTGGAIEEPVELPLDRHDHFRIRWPEGRFSESFRHVSWRTLHQYRRSLTDLMYNLNLMNDAGFVPTAFESLPGLVAAVEESEASLAFSDRRELVQAVLALSGRYLQGESEERIAGRIEPLLVAEDVSPAVREEAESVLSDLRESFEGSRALYRNAVSARDRIEAEVEGSFVLVGYTATSTTDLGVTPFDESYANVGVHGAVANMILQGERLRYLPSWSGLVLGLLLAVANTVFLRRTAGGKAIALAAGGVLVPLLVSTALLLFASVYFPALSALVAPLMVGAVLLAGNYLEVSKEKAVVRDAFEHYLAPEVVSQLLDDPARLNVGGTEAELTVLFSDVAGFSRIGEQLAPGELVELLNNYLTEMSDVIMNRGGTIDKYEGDAVLAFFGAPLPLTDHSQRAAAAALQMKKLEVLLNSRFIKEELSPSPLITRIGINSGPMIVGNLGTTRRMNYTVMGHSVNLAARLEGINKTYGTTVCISESTRTALDGDFLVRRMDRIRAVGMDKPVRLYELVGLYDESTAPLREALTIFEKGVDAFEDRDWQRARDHFSTVLRIYPDDGPATLFLGRCDSFLDSPPRETWDGVISLSEK